MRRPFAHPSWLVLACLSTLSVCLMPLHAAAGARAPEPPPASPPGIVVAGDANVRGLSVEVRCTEETLVETSARCEVRAHFVLEALEPVEVTAPAVSGVTAVSLRIGGRELLSDTHPSEGGRQALGLGEVVEVDLSFVVALHTETTFGEEPLLLTPVRARHLIFGEATSMRHAGDALYGIFVEGPSLHFTDGVAVVRETGAVGLSVGGQAVDSGTYEVAHAGYALSLEGSVSSGPILENGGPVLGLGGRFDLYRPDEGRFLLRVGYELGLADYVVASLSFETDFDSIMESVVIEVGSPEALILLPSISAGIGIVARQLGNRDADAALRLRLGYQVTAIGLGVDFDYWPAFSDWTASFVVRLSV